MFPSDQGNVLSGKTLIATQVIGQVVRKDLPVHDGYRPKKSLWTAQFVKFSEEFKKVVNKLVAIDITKSMKHYGSLLLFLGGAAVIVCLGSLLYRHKNEHKRFMTTTRLSLMDKEVQRACRYIEENYSDHDLGLTKICRALVTGEAFLEALFMKELGLTTNDFIDQVRINRAKIQLRKTSSQNPAALAVSVGYPDTETFYRSFHRIAGVDFTAYRSSLKDSEPG